MKVAIVNDQTLAVEALRRALALDSLYEVIWVANNGIQAIEMAIKHRPDIILMDLLMPVMDGVEATKRIMQQAPCAIIIVTSDKDKHLSRVFEAMGYGALDAVNTPSFSQNRADFEPLFRKIYNVGLLVGAVEKRPQTGIPAVTSANTSKKLIAIGASAGGPAALATILKALPRSFNAAIVLIQHVDEVFAGSMATWLATQCQLPIRLAKDNEEPIIGTVLLAGTNHHAQLLSTGRIVYTQEPSHLVYRPSVDVFFESVAQTWKGQAVGVLLTGMGRDGAKGLKTMKDKGFLTIAQDEQSSAVYGMPKAAAAIGAAHEILALDKIAARLIKAVGG
ncbi:chemotaxis response regulator protein-glutamate methylesterase [Agitococcus lubricus]|uniref:Protein-glutamate methylesterase/protein-glutamine glutaminase n=1 Tax=Agitococcus lubricus TaxID=1077255 RepID=A0A2T5IVP0_9GAMM|nr:chemotaxis response regulator protein-glutamate methylesterase [Agitococcus lubricus]PTQ87881.1 two-component system response regulator WspF [Agitococcus lubricus]